MRKLTLIPIVIAAACGGSSNKPEPQKPVENAAGGSSSESGAFASMTGTGDVAPEYDDSAVDAAGTSGNGQVSAGDPKAVGDLDKDVIRQSVRQNISKVQYCYEKQLLAEPSLQGTVTATFTIAPDGTVSSSTATGVHAGVSSCVAGVLKGIVFPKPTGGGSVTVNYPFVFKPS